jgi:hypothetical protein
LGSGFWVLGFGFWVLGFGFWVLGFGFWVLGWTIQPRQQSHIAAARLASRSLVWFSGLGFRFRVLGFEFRVRVSGCEVRVSGFGFRVKEYFVWCITTLIIELMLYY